jgi:hypothetical protein
MSLFDKQQNKSRGRPKLSYREGEWDVWLTNGQYKVRLSYPTHRIYGSPPNQTVEEISWTYDALERSLQGQQRKYAVAYGGKWDMIVIESETIPYPLDRPVGARGKAEAIILAGRDTPGKRFLQGLGENRKSGNYLARANVATLFDLTKEVESQKPRMDNVLQAESVLDEDIPF